jgi:crossover junction endodeoxyribonuclease RuvC
MIVLGVDPGTHNTGWGVVSRRGTTLTAVAAGVIRTNSDAPLHERLLTIHHGLEQVIEEHRPDCMAVEDIFSRYPKSALKLGQARGVVLLAGAIVGLDVSSYPPAVVKRSVAGRGQAPKKQLARIVGAILGLAELPPVDATDALAVAITHANAAR